MTLNASFAVISDHIIFCSLLQGAVFYRGKTRKKNALQTANQKAVKQFGRENLPAAICKFAIAIFVQRRYNTLCIYTDDIMHLIYKGIE